MFKKSRSDYNRRQSKSSRDFHENFVGDGSFTYCGVDCTFVIKKSGPDTFCATVNYDRDDVSGSDRSRFENGVAGELYRELSKKFNVLDVSVYAR